MRTILAALVIAGLAVIPCSASTGYDDLVKLVKSEVTEEVLVAYIDTYPAAFALTPDNIVELKKLGASDKVISAAIQHRMKTAQAPAQNSDSPAEAPQPAPAQAATPQPAPQPAPTVVYQTVPAQGYWYPVDDYWYWRYPSGVIVDRGWQPYHHHYGHGYPHFRHGRR
jgi:hypothetical protein